jgi:hypothetical protein
METSDTHINNYQETFTTIVQGKDIPECRFNAWQALDHSIGILPREGWKLAQAYHTLDPQSGQVLCTATFLFDPNADGGIGAEEIEPSKVQD